jgi:hypothetical protein
LSAALLQPSCRSRVRREASLTNQIDNSPVFFALLKVIQG